MMRSIKLVVSTVIVSVGILAVMQAVRPLHADVSFARDTAEKDEAGRRGTAEEQQVVAAIEAIFKAAERNDLVALDSLYAGTDLTVVEGAGINRGWADYRDHHLAPELKEMKGFRYRPFEIEPHVSGNLAWAIFRYTIQAELGTRTLDLVGRGTAILEKRRGRWVVRHTQTASRARRPTDPPIAP